MSLTRREMIAASMVAGTATGSQAAETIKSMFYDLRYYYMRTDRTDMGRRTNTFLSSVYVPAAKKAGAGLIGLFGSNVAANGPFALCVTSYPSLAAMDSVREKLAASEDYQKALADYNSGDAGFVKIESWLLRAFDIFPNIDASPDPKRPPRIFELRTYQSLNESTLQRKIKMFGSGEVGIFRRVGITPVFFGEALVGANLPHLTYMSAFENHAAREKAWAAFRVDPEWVKLSTSAEFSAPGLVTNISNSIVSPLNGSDIR